MRYTQLEFEFRSPDEIEALNREEQQYIKEFEDQKYYRINKYADWWCERVPRIMGWGLYDFYNSTITFVKSTYQKCRYGVSDQECWSLSETFANYMIPRLKHFRKIKNKGVPCSVYVGPQLPCNKNAIVLEPVKIAEDKWNAILDEIIWTFEYISDSDKFITIPDTKPFREKNKNTPLDKLLDGIFDEKSKEENLLWVEYFEKVDQLNERRNNGLQLFAKHFNDLWY